MSDAGPTRPHIVILGLMGVGKTTTGEGLAKRLGRPLIDSDTDIETLTGGSGRAFAAEHGVAALHRLEAAVLLGALTRTEPAVITAAASTVDDALVRTVLPMRAVAVRLDVDHDETIRRQAAGGHRRPMDRAELAALAARREPLFATMADVEIRADRSPDELIDEIVHRLGLGPGPGPGLGLEPQTGPGSLG